MRYIYAFGKNMNPSLPHLNMVNPEGRGDSLTLVWKSVKEKRKSDFKPAILNLKIDL